MKQATTVVKANPLDHESHKSSLSQLSPSAVNSLYSQSGSHKMRTDAHAIRGNMQLGTSDIHAKSIPPRSTQVAGSAIVQGTTTEKTVKQ